MIDRIILLRFQNGHDRQPGEKGQELSNLNAVKMEVCWTQRKQNSSRRVQRTAEEEKYSVKVGRKNKRKNSINTIEA